MIKGHDQPPGLCSLTFFETVNSFLHFYNTHRTAEDGVFKTMCFLLHSQNLATNYKVRNLDIKKFKNYCQTSLPTVAEPGTNLEQGHYSVCD